MVVLSSHEHMRMNDNRIFGQAAEITVMAAGMFGGLSD
jgi:hypothetical protein